MLSALTTCADADKKVMQSALNLTHALAVVWVSGQGILAKVHHLFAGTAATNSQHCWTSLLHVAC